MLVLFGLPFAGSSGTNTGLLSMALGTGALLALVFVLLFAEWRAALPEPMRHSVLVARAVGRRVGVLCFVVVRSVGRDLYRVPFAASKQTEQLHGVPPIRGLRLDPATRRMIDQVVTAASRWSRSETGKPDPDVDESRGIRLCARRLRSRRGLDRCKRDDVLEVDERAR